MPAPRSDRAAEERAAVATPYAVVYRSRVLPFDIRCAAREPAVAAGAIVAARSR